MTGDGPSKKAHEVVKDSILNPPAVTSAVNTRVATRLGVMSGIGMGWVQCCQEWLREISRLDASMVCYTG